MISEAWTYETIPGEIAFLNGIFEAYTELLLEDNLYQDQCGPGIKSTVFSIGEDGEIPIDEALRTYFKTNRDDVGSYDENNNFISIRNTDLLSFDMPLGSDEGKHVYDARSEIENALYEMFSDFALRNNYGEKAAERSPEIDERLKANIQEYTKRVTWYFHYLRCIRTAGSPILRKMHDSQCFYYLSVDYALFFVFTDRVLLLTVGYED